MEYIIATICGVELVSGILGWDVVILVSVLQIHKLLNKLLWRCNPQCKMQA
jgi:hypothetical protein